MNGGAWIVGDHRYRLWRAWEAGAPSVVWVMLNPSTADAKVDDPTIRKCIGFAKRWGYGSIDVVNLYTFRSASPKELKAKGYPNGDRADAVIRGVLSEYADRVVFAWGTNADEGRPLEVDRIVRDLGFSPMALRTTQDGHPGHPLYIPYETEPEPWTPKSIDELIEASSFGTSEAKAIRAQASPGAVDEVMRRMKESDHG